MLDIFKRILYNINIKVIIILVICGFFLLSGIFSCPVYETIGIPCPTCGITRAYKLFLTGHVADAFCMHPLFLLPLIFLFPKFRNRKTVIFVISIFVIVYIFRFNQLFPDAEPFNINYDSDIVKILMKIH